MSRYRDWEARLVAYLTSVSRRAFKPGAHDCAQFTGGAIEAMTGVNPAKAYAGRYASIKSGVRAARRAGFDDHVAVAASLYKEVHPAFAHTGDIGVVDGDDGFGALGIVQGEGVYVVGPSGLGIVSRSKMKRAFRV